MTWYNRRVEENLESLGSGFSADNKNIDEFLIIFLPERLLVFIGIE